MSQPVDVYPDPVIRSQPESSHSNGSYGPVFIVLAVIVVISAVACVLGRLCDRRRHQDKDARHHQVHHQPPKPNAAHDHQQSRDLGAPPKEGEARDKPRIALRERADIEFGFDKRTPSSKVTTYGGGMVEPPQSTGGRKPEVRFADNV